MHKMSKSALSLGARIGSSLKTQPKYGELLLSLEHKNLLSTSAAESKMLRGATRHRQLWCLIASRFSTTNTNTRSISKAVDSMLLRSLKDHYLEISKMNPPPKVNPPSEFTIVKGSLDSEGPVLTRKFKNEEISISVMRLATIIPVDNEESDDEDDINQLFLHVNVTKPGHPNSLQFLCGLYPDALGIHSVSLRPNVNHDSNAYLELPNTYTSPSFEDLDERMRDAFHSYIEERGVNENLFMFLQSWLYVKEHRNLMRWFKAMGIFINEKQSANDVECL